MVDVKEVKAQMLRKDVTQAELAKRIGMDPSTLNRKINNVEGENLTVKEVNRIVAALSLPRDSITSIFFATELTET